MVEAERLPIGDASQEKLIDGAYWQLGAANSKKLGNVSHGMILVVISLNTLGRWPCAHLAFFISYLKYLVYFRFFFHSHKYCSPPNHAQATLIHFVGKFYSPSVKDFLTKCFCSSWLPNQIFFFLFIQIIFFIFLNLLFQTRKFC